MNGVIVFFLRFCSLPLFKIYSLGLRQEWRNRKDSSMETGATLGLKANRF